jgi:hypothetical protein
MGLMVTREQLSKLSDTLTDEVGPGIGFALFIRTGEAWSYTSNCHRPDVVAGLTEWLKLTEKGLVKAPGHKESSVQVDDRLALERKCVELGKRIGEELRMGLFLFEMNGSSSAYTSNVPDFRERVAAWVKIQKDRN